MIKRICHIDNDIDNSIFLFGARQTGKSTFLRQTFPNCIYIDLLNTTLKNRFKRRPGLLYEMLADKPDGTKVVIDEIPEVPELLDEVHRLMSEKDHKFVLCGCAAHPITVMPLNILWFKN